jgi:hypothetical protein
MDLNLLSGPQDTRFFHAKNCSTALEMTEQLLLPHLHTSADSSKIMNAINSQNYHSAVRVTTRNKSDEKLSLHYDDSGKMACKRNVIINDEETCTTSEDVRTPDSSTQRTHHQLWRCLRTGVASPLSYIRGRQSDQEFHHFTK